MVLDYPSSLVGKPSISSYGLILPRCNLSVIFGECFAFIASPLSELVNVACSAVWCAAGWSRKAVNEARPWWRRGSSSWRWVSGVDWAKISSFQYSQSVHVIARMASKSFTGEAWSLARTFLFSSYARTRREFEFTFSEKCCVKWWLMATKQSQQQLLTEFLSYSME